MNSIKNWKIYNNILINQGRPSYYLDSTVANYKKDLQEMNNHKVGAPYAYSNLLIIAGFAIKSLFKIRYRKTSGLMADIEEKEL